MGKHSIVDADGHIIENIGELRTYLDPPFDKRGGPLTHSEPWDRDLLGTLPRASRGYNRQPLARDWIALMDKNGIGRSFLYPTALGNVSRIPEKDYAVALCKAYNNYAYERYARVSGRLNPVGVIPSQDPNRAVVELRRVVGELGYNACVIRTTGLRFPLGHSFYDPIYRAAEELECVIAVHATNGGEELASGSFETFTEVHTVSFPVGIMRQFTSMIYQGVPERFPNLRLAFLEIGCTWLPYWLDRMDENWEKRGSIETPNLKRLPSECVRKSLIYFSFEAGEALLPETINYLGEDHFVYASDFPHWDHEFPENIHRIQERNDLTESVKKKLLCDNARSLYSITAG